MAVDRFLVSNLLKLNGLDEFEPYRKWLREQRDFWRDALETQTDADRLRIAQGRAQMLKEILESLESAPGLAKKMGGNTVL